MNKTQYWFINYELKINTKKKYNVISITLVSAKNRITMDRNKFVKFHRVPRYCQCVCYLG